MCEDVNFNFAVVLYRYEILSLILREELRVSVPESESRLPREIFGPRRGKMTGEWRQLHNKELRNLYSLSKYVRVIGSKRMRRAWHVARIREK
jgi:hypothetical protein